jgi:hypothetical protein
VAQGCFRYRCFLPDLTGFTVPPCTGPNYQQSTSTKMINTKWPSDATLSVAYCLFNGGEGGIRTPGTRIRGTHDFQSCTFNRSVTSPDWNFKHLRALPHFPNGQCLQNVSMGLFELVSERTTMKNRGQRRIARGKKSAARYTIGGRALKKYFRFLTSLWSMSPRCLH